MLLICRQQNDGATEKHKYQFLKLSKLCKGQKIFSIFVAIEMKTFNVNQEKVDWLPLSFEV